MTEQQPPTPEPPAAAPPTPERPTPAPPAAASPTAEPSTPAYGPPRPGGPYGDPAFLAPPRPRVLWINPQRRAHVAGAGLALALVCGGAGVAIGWAASDHHDDRGRFGVRFAPRYGEQYLPGPDRMHPDRPGEPAAPTPVPTSTR